MIDLVVLSGPQGAGKTTLLEELKRLHGKLKYDYFQSYKFADTLYELHDYILNRMQVLTGKPRVAKDGVLLQLLGTEWGRKQFGPNIWVHLLMARYHQYEGLMKNSRALVVIDDCRFENEFDALQKEGLMVRLRAPESLRKARADAWRDNTKHPSETGLDAYEVAGCFDLYLDTSGDDLEKCANLIISQLQKGSWKEKRETGG